MISDKGGWTPGNRQAAASVARSMGLRPGDDLHLDDPAMLSRFRRGLMVQELGPAGARYYHEHAAGEARGRLLHRKVSVHAAPGGNTSLSSAAAAAGSQ